MPSSIFSGLSTFGARLAKDDPQYPASQDTLYMTPGDDSSLLKLPTVEDLYADSPFRFKGAYFIQSLGTRYLLDALTLLANGFPLSDAIPASGAQFQQYNGGILGALSGPFDHANLIVDYEWLGGAGTWSIFLSALNNGDAATASGMNASLLFHCLNSWGQTWGESDSIAGCAGGMYRADISYFNQAQSIACLDFTIVN